MRIYEFARARNMAVNDVIAACEKMGIAGKKSASGLTPDEIARLDGQPAAKPARPKAKAAPRKAAPKKKPAARPAEKPGVSAPEAPAAPPVAPPAPPPPPPPPPERRKIELTGKETIGEMARILDVTLAEMAKKLLTLGMPTGVAQKPGIEKLRKVATAFDVDVDGPEPPPPPAAVPAPAVVVAPPPQAPRPSPSAPRSAAPAPEPAAAEPPLPPPPPPPPPPIPEPPVAPPSPPEKLVARAPVVTIMGHVDHGKTTILDAIRKSRVALKEFGQITQKTGAYKVALPQGGIVFLDTPGHEAFTAMRARGAQATDIVVLVVAADEGVKPQTIEAADHARSAKVPIIVAINKIDRPNINLDRVRTQLAEINLAPEDWGGETVTVRLSAATGEGLKDLLDMILLVAEMQELRADPDRAATGVVVESQIHRARGPVLTVLVQDGTLRTGDVFVAGQAWGKVRAIVDDMGNRLPAAGPSTPVEVLGGSEAATPGTRFVVVASERDARMYAETRREAGRPQQAGPRKISLEDLYREVKKGAVKELKIVLKADLAGSVEAIRGLLERIRNPEVGVSIIHTGTGAVNESDILLAAASNGIVVGFNVGFDGKSEDVARREGVDVKTYRLIYDLAEDIQRAVDGLLEPVEEEVLSGQAVVKKVFDLSKSVSVAGCLVVEGKVVRDSLARVIREGKVISEGRLTSLKRFKDTVKEVAANTECGIGLDSFKTFKEGDVIQSFIRTKVLRKLEAPR